MATAKKVQQKTRRNKKSVFFIMLMISVIELV
jgi:hypothetical protein